jgi:hypothetical protein
MRAEFQRLMPCPWPEDAANHFCPIELSTIWGAVYQGKLKSTGKPVYGKVANRSLRSSALAASPSSGVTPKISCIVRRVELWV